MHWMSYIEQYDPCYVYYQYLEDGAITGQSTLKSILKDTYIFPHHKAWLIEKILETAILDSKSRLLTVSSHLNGVEIDYFLDYRVHHKTSYTFEEILPMLEWCLTLIEEREEHE